MKLFFIRFYFLSAFMLLSLTLSFGQSLQFSPQRGFFDQPIQVTLQTNLPGATIRYTVNGSEPTTATGTIYTTPISLSTTSYVRAIAYSTSETLESVTHTYFYLNDVLTDPDLNTWVTQDSIWGPQMIDAWQQIPTVSLVSDSAIIPHIKNEISFEFFHEKTGENVQVNAGGENYGNASLGFIKKNIRVHFSDTFGPKNFEYPIFEKFAEGIQPIEKFDKLDLRSSHDSWLWNTGYLPFRAESYMTTKLMDNIMLHGGSINPHTRHVHVYQNGKYHGLFTLREKFDDNLLAEYFNGDDEDYDFVSGSKVTVSAFYPSDGVLKDGTGIQWNNLVANSSNYNLWKPDVNENSFYDMILLFMYGWAEAEWNATGSPSTGVPFHFQVNDADLFFTRGFITKSNRVHPFHSANGPNNMFKNLVIENDPDFKMAFADRVHLLLKENGALTPNTIDAHYKHISKQIDTAIIAESARWGDDPTESPAQWQHKIDTMYELFMKHQTDSVLVQLKDQDLYPTHEPVDYPLTEGLYPVGTSIPINNPNSTGTIYYTTNGEDPRLPGGAINPNALAYTGPISLAQGPNSFVARVLQQQTHHNKTNVALNKPSSQISTRAGFDAFKGNDGDYFGIWGLQSMMSTNTHDHAWWEVDLQSVQPVHEVVIYNRGDYGAVTYFADMNVFVSDVPFTSDDPDVLKTDGAVRSYFFSGIGADIAKVKLSSTESGRYIRVQNEYRTVLRCSEIEVIQYDYANPIVKDVWSSMRPHKYYTQQDYSGIVINEIHYNPEDSIDIIAQDTSGNEREEFIELYNNSTTPIDLAYASFTNGLEFTFEYPSQIPPGGFFVLARDKVRFIEKYGFAPHAQYGGKLKNGGERLFLESPYQSIIDSLRYNDKNPWPLEANGLGPSAELIHPGLDNALGQHWIASFNKFGTPNAPNGGQCSNTDDIIINEIQAGGPQTFEIMRSGDWVELHNTGGLYLDLSGWVLEDSDSLFTLPAGSFIAPGGFMIIASDPADFFNVHPSVGGVKGPLGFNLKSEGEVLLLRKPDGCITDFIAYENKTPWPDTVAMDNRTLSVSNPNIDKHLSSRWAPSAQYGGSPGQPNDFSICVGGNSTPMVLNEINYKSPSTPDAGDWIEIYNPDTLSVQSLSGWEFHDGENHYKFSASQQIQPGEYLVVVQDGASFSSVHPGIPFLGPMGFGLDGDGEQIALLDSKRCVIVDQVLYNDSPPWDTMPDGNGPTLALTFPNLDNALSTSWIESTWGHSPKGSPTQPNWDEDPIAVTDTFYTLEDTGVFGNLLLNDYDPEGDAIILNPNPFTQPLNGTVTLNNSGVMSYNPNPDYFGWDEFEYRIFAATGSAVGTVRIYIEPVNDAPLAMDDSITIAEDGASISLNVLTNDSDIDGQFGATNLITTPLAIQGGASLVAGILNFTPASNYYGTFSISYQVCDDGIPNPILCDTATIWITVFPVNDAPITMVDSFIMYAYDTLNSDLLLNDSDLEGQPLVVTNAPILAPQNGTVLISQSGAFTYVPTPGFVGQDSFIYEVCETDIPLIGLTVWLDGNDVNANGVQPSNNSNITSWKDKSGEGNDIALTTGDGAVWKANQMNGNGILEFDGDWYSSASGLNLGFNHTVFYVLKNEVGNRSWVQSNPFNIDAYPLNQFRVNYFNGGGVPSNWNVLSNVSDNTTGLSTFNVNGALTLTGPKINAANKVLTVGGRSDNVSYPLKGDIAEVIVYNRVLTQAERSAVEAYLESKWLTFGQPAPLCSQEKVYIDVQPQGLELDMHVWLEGTYEVSTGKMYAELGDVKKILPGQTPTNAAWVATPAGQPFNVAPWNYAGQEGTGFTNADYDQIKASSGNEAVVDWVHIDVRTGTGSATSIGSAAGLILQNGKIHLTEPINIQASLPSQVYVVLEQRNHLAVMTPIAVPVINKLASHDFRAQDSWSAGGGFGQKQLSDGSWVMYVGDNQKTTDGLYRDIDGNDKTMFSLQNGIFGSYLPSDFDLNGDITGADKVIFSNNNGISSSVER